MRQTPTTRAHSPVKGYGKNNFSGLHCTHGSRILDLETGSLVTHEACSSASVLAGAKDSQEDSRQSQHKAPAQTYNRRGPARAAASSARTNGAFILRSARSVRTHAIQWDGARMQLTNEDVRARRCEGSWGLSGCGNPDWTVGMAGKHPCKHGQQGTGSARQSEQEDKNHTYRRCATQYRH